ncbi:MAG: hypothetical protein ACXWJ4_10560 [Methyloceanibacter sp.]
MAAELDAVATELLSEHDLATEVKGVPKEFRTRYRDLYQAFSAAITKLQKDLNLKRAALSETEGKWATDFQKARTARDGALSKLSAHQTVTQQIIKLKEELTSAKNEVAGLEAQLKGETDPAAALTAAIGDLTCDPLLAGFWLVVARLSEPPDVRPNIRPLLLCNL